MFPSSGGTDPICNAAFSTNSTRFVGVTAEGASGIVPVGTVTFVAGNDLGEYPVWLSVETLATPDANVVGSVELTGGTVSITTLAPTPAPQNPTTPSPHPAVPPLPASSPRPQLPHVPGASRLNSAVFEGTVCRNVRCSGEVGGSKLVARIGKVECGSSLVNEDNSYQIEVASDAEVRGCGAPGRMIEFIVDGEQARPAAIWKAGAQQMDLVLTGGFKTGSPSLKPAETPSGYPAKGVREELGPAGKAKASTTSSSGDIGRLVLLLSAVPALIGVVSAYRNLKRR